MFLEQRRTASTSLEAILPRICFGRDIVTKFNRVNEETRNASGSSTSRNHLDPLRSFSYGLPLGDNLQNCLFHNAKELIKCIPFSESLFNFKDPPQLRRWTLRKENQIFLSLIPVSSVIGLLLPALFGSLFKFTIVRNPFDQILSW